MGYSLSKLSEKCKACSKVDKCDNKRMELCTLAELPTVCANSNQPSMESCVAPILREKIESPLSPFIYRDELEKELYKALSINHMMFGA